MPTQGQRQEFLWRPNDNSTTTKLRYDLETKHWMDSIRSHQITSSSASFGESMFILGGIIGFLLGLIYLILSGIVSLFETKPKHVPFAERIDNYKLPDDMVFHDDYTTEELDKMFNDPNIERI